MVAAASEACTGGVCFGSTAPYVCFWYVMRTDRRLPGMGAFPIVEFLGVGDDFVLFGLCFCQIFVK